KIEMVNEFTSSITFTALRRSHAGRYTCLARNAAASDRHWADLDVNGKRKAISADQTSDILPFQWHRVGFSSRMISWQSRANNWSSIARRKEFPSHRSGGR